MKALVSNFHEKQKREAGMRKEMLFKCRTATTTMLFSVSTNLVAGDANEKDDIFVHDTQTGATTRVSVDSAGANCG